MEVVPFKIAKKLKEKGFNYPCMDAINSFGCTYRNGWCEYLDDREGEFITLKDLRERDFLLPTISQVLKWLREEKEIFIRVTLSYDYSTDADGEQVDRWTFWLFEVFSVGSGSLIYTEEISEYDSYELAALAGISYVIDNLI